MKLSDSVGQLPGVGPKREAALAAAGIKTVGQLLTVYPRAYLNRAQRGHLADLPDEAKSFLLRTTKTPVLRHIRKNMSILSLAVVEIAEDGQATPGEVIWFNQPYLVHQFEANTDYYFYGKVQRKNNKYCLYNPQSARADEPGDFFRLTPVYKKLESFPEKSLIKAIAAALDNLDKIADPLPETIRRDYQLPDLAWTLEKIHRPQALEEVERARERLAFEEALKINLGIMGGLPGARETSIHINHPDALRTFTASLPFALTTGQQDVLSEIIGDLIGNKVMNRLVQGDVGSGKTILAVACAYLMAREGYQTAYMAPTEILAEQHGETFRKFLAPFDIPVAVVTGRLKKAEAEALRERIAAGEIMVIVGTHALIQKSTDYYNLGLVITDEQHRFGVRQRGELSRKGDTPHTLVMSATPIPRSLALILYGDLDVSYIGELPKGRKKIKTYFYREQALGKILKFTAGELAAGRQAFVVCPFVEQSEEMPEVRDVTSVADKLKEKLGQTFRVAALHAKLPKEEQEEVAAAFAAGELDLLVATSIIEVGIDVPNATTMIVLSADRFGLSQLHQLRGRVGRGQDQAYCFLVSDTKSEATLERMKVIVNQSDGRLIAEEDFRLRGPGDYFGLRQHGLPEAGVLNPYEDMGLIAATRELAREILSSPKVGMIRYRTAAIKEFTADLEAVSMT